MFALSVPTRISKFRKRVPAIVHHWFGVMKTNSMMLTKITRTSIQPATFVLHLKLTPWFLVCKTLMMTVHAYDIITIAYYCTSRLNRMIPMNKRSCLDAIFIFTCGTVGCHNDNLLRQQTRQSWHHNNYRFSVFNHHSPRLIRLVISTCVTLVGKANCTFHQGWTSSASVWVHNSSLLVIPSTALLALWSLSVELWLAGRLSAKFTSPVSATHCNLRIMLVLFCFVRLHYQSLVGSFDLSSHVFSMVASLLGRQCQWSNLEGYGWIGTH